MGFYVDFVPGRVPWFQPRLRENRFVSGRLRYRGKKKEEMPPRLSTLPRESQYLEPAALVNQGARAKVGLLAAFWGDTARE